MTRFFLLPLLLLIGGCSLFDKAPETFEQHYNNYMSHSIDSLDAYLKEIGFMQGGSVSGDFDALISLPVPLSGSLTTEYALDRSGRDISLALTDGEMRYSGLAGSGGVVFEALKLISQKGDTHILFDNIESATSIPSEIQSILKKYNDTWLTWTQAESRARITDVTELQNLVFFDNLSQLHLSQVESYLNRYPIWRSTGEVSMSGSMRIWPVALDKDNLLELIVTVKTDMTGSGLSQEEIDDTRTSLEDIELAGTMSFDTQNQDSIDTHLVLTGTGGQRLALLDITQQPSQLSIHVHDVAKDTDINLLLTSGDTSIDSIIQLSQSGTELARLTGRKTHKKIWPRQFSLELQSEGQVNSIYNTLDKSGVFEGKILLPLTAITWSGAFDSRSLSTLKLQGTSPEGTIDMHLTSSGGMARGPLTVTMDNQELFRADIGLLLSPDAARLILDIAQGTGSTQLVHSEIGLTFKKTATQSIVTPSRTSSLTQFIEEFTPNNSLGSTEEAQDISQ